MAMDYANAMIELLTLKMLLIRINYKIMIILC